jgi:hypothetical protein
VLATLINFDRKALLLNLFICFQIFSEFASLQKDRVSVVSLILKDRSFDITITSLTMFLTFWANGAFATFSDTICTLYINLLKWEVLFKSIDMLLLLLLLHFSLNIPFLRSAQELFECEAMLCYLINFKLKFCSKAQFEILSKLYHFDEGIDNRFNYLHVLIINLLFEES